MDIVAKHAKPDKNGVRIAELNVMTYRNLLWNHVPITDFWRVGKGYEKKLNEHRIYTMGDIARTSIENEELLYKLFGVNAELLIDHSWGWECVTIDSIKNYKPQTKSLSSGQVLHCPYNFEKARLILKEMVELQVLEMVEKNYVTDQLVLDITYDVENLSSKEYSKFYNGEIKIDRYGRNIPKPAHGTFRLENHISSTKLIMNGFLKLYDDIVNRKMLIRKINICVGNLLNETEIKEKNKYEQIDLFTNYGELEEKKKKEEKELQKEKALQNAIINIKSKYGKNALIKGMNLEEGATTIERNGQIGGHKG